MIGKITGRVDYRGTDHVLVDVQGVGYMVYCSDRTLSGLPARGGVIALYVRIICSCLVLLLWLIKNGISY